MKKSSALPPSSVSFTTPAIQISTLQDYHHIFPTYPLSCVYYQGAMFFSYPLYALGFTLCVYSPPSSILWWLVLSSPYIVSSAYPALAVPYLTFTLLGTLSSIPSLQIAGNLVCSRGNTSADYIRLPHTPSKEPAGNCLVRHEHNYC